MSETNTPPNSTPAQSQDNGGAVRKRSKKNDAPEAPEAKEQPATGQKPAVRRRAKNRVPQWVWIGMGLVGIVTSLTTLLLPAGDLTHVSTSKTGCPYVPDDSVVGYFWVNGRRIWGQAMVAVMGERQFTLEELREYDGRATAPNPRTTFLRGKIAAGDCPRDLLTQRTWKTPI